MKFQKLKLMNGRHRHLWQILMNGNGNLACCCVMKEIGRLFLEIREIGETSSKYPALLKGWDFIGIPCA